MADIFEEIDDELKQENLKKLWSRYGRYIVAAAVAAVLITAGVVGWRHYEGIRQERTAAAFAAAIERGEFTDDKMMAARLAAFADDASRGYAVLARLREAAARTRAGERAAAVDIYRMLAGDRSVDGVYRGLARLHLAMLLLEDEGGGAVAELSETLEPLLRDDSPWRHSARELAAAGALRNGETERARGLLQRLADDLDAPQGARARAAELLAALEVQG